MTRGLEIDCNELVEVVTDYLEGILDGERHRRFAEHLKRCKGCETYVAQIRETVRLVGTLREEDLFPDEHLCPDMRDKLLAAFRGWKAGTASQPS